jgi:anti-sigma factor ChrR (cupin superfamily)
VHSGGEEYLVLSGTFQDEHGDFPTGSYVRNPPQSSHTPRSDDGAVIMVKLWQFDMDDRTAVTLRPDDTTSVDGVTLLHHDDWETVRIENWNAGADITIPEHGGVEVFVIAGGFSEAGEDFNVDSWLRLPVGADLVAKAGKNGARVWIKTGHLRVPPVAPNI